MSADGYTVPERPSLDLHRVEFFVAGLAKAKGSMKGFVVNGRAIVTNSNAKTRTWEGAIAAAGREAMAGRAPWLGPVLVHLVFFLPRPSGHFGSKGLRPSAPSHCAVKPDVDKLCRGALDGMTGIVFGDDSRVVRLVAEKRYATEGAGVAILVEEF